MSSSLSPRKPATSLAQEGASRLRVQRTVAHALGISRRAADALVVDGRVSLNGQVAVPGTKHDPGDRISVDGELLPTGNKDAVRIIAYRKSIGEITSRMRPYSVFENLPRLRTGRWIVVGRLDVATTGLLLFTNDGATAERLAHPRFELEREYVASSPDLISARVRAAAVRDGIDIDGRTAQPMRFDLLAGRSDRSCRYRIVVGEGRNRLVRRIFEELDARINRLERVRFGNLRIPPQLRPGESVEVALELILGAQSGESRP